MEKEYIGDGAFVHYDGFHIVLTTSDGVRDTNTIALEPAVMRAFSAWLVVLEAKIPEKEHDADG